MFYFVICQKCLVYQQHRINIQQRINQIESQYEEDLKGLASVVESKINELRVKKGISTTGNCSNVDTQSTKSILYN